MQGNSTVQISKIMWCSKWLTFKFDQIVANTTLEFSTIQESIYGCPLSIQRYINKKLLPMYLEVSNCQRKKGVLTQEVSQYLFVQYQTPYFLFNFFKLLHGLQCYFQRLAVTLPPSTQTNKFQRKKGVLTQECTIFLCTTLHPLFFLYSFWLSLKFIGCITVLSTKACCDVITFNTNKY